MESERDALAKDLYEISVPGYKWEKVSPKAHKDFWLSQADELIKAGYRRVDAEHVVVRRSDADIARDVLIDAMYGTGSGRGELEGVANRLLHALSAGGEET